jgi:hypothetical protein
MRAKKQKLHIKVEPKKIRKTWAINPRERIHDGEGYDRHKDKEELRNIIVDEEVEE